MARAYSRAESFQQVFRALHADSLHERGEPRAGAGGGVVKGKEVGSVLGKSRCYSVEFVGYYRMTGWAQGRGGLMASVSALACVGHVPDAHINQWLGCQVAEMQRVSSVPRRWVSVRARVCGLRHVAGAQQRSAWMRRTC